MKAKKVVAVFMTAAMTMGMLAGCGSNSNSGSANTGRNAGSNAADSSDASESTAAGTESTGNIDTADLAGTQITMLNSKGEIQTALEDMAEAFKEDTGIELEVQACGTGESPYTRVTSAYNSGTAPTMAILDTTDVVALASQYAVDLSDEEWVKECVNQTTQVDGKIYSFPFCVEGRGIIYNKTAIEDTLGEEFDPSTINSYDALKELLENLRAGGMENPVVISKEDWSLGAHQLGFIYDSYDGTTEGSAKVIDELKAGTLKAEDYDRFNEFMDTFDLLSQYNINGEDPLGALYDQDPIFLADGDAALWINGCWAWPNLKEAGASDSDEYGFLPYVLGNDTSDFANNGIQASASKQLMIDAEQSTPEQQEAAKAFVNWLVYSDNGQKMLVEDAAVIPACKNNTYEALDPLGKDIQAKMSAGNTYSSSFIAPSDHWSVLGASMQKYLGGQCTRDDLAADIDNYWTSQN